jgi:hypothetical protein
MAHRIDDPWAEYRRLIDAELESLRMHIGHARVVELERRLEQIPDSDATRSNPRTDA